MPEAPIRPRVAHLTSAHQWNDVRIFLKEARSLAQAGYDVSVIAQREENAVVQDVSCIGIPTPRTRLERMVFCPWRVFAKAKRYDICHLHDPELLPIGVLLKMLGHRVIYDAHEHLPQQIEDKHWIAPGLRRAVGVAAGLFEKASVSLFDRVVVATPTISQRFRWKEPVLVRNFPLLEEFAESLSPAYQTRPPHFAYVGAVSRSRCLLEMMQAVARLNAPNARLIVGGSMSEDGLEQEAAESPGAGSTDFVGYLKRDQVCSLLGEVRAGLVVLKPTPNHVNSLPIKLFEYMIAGLPVIASDFPLWREIVDGAGAGLLVEPDNINSFAAALRWILEHPQDAEEMGRRGRDAVLTRYNWGSEKEALLAMYASLS